MSRVELCLTRGRYPWENTHVGITDSELLSVMAGDDSLAQDLGTGGFAMIWSGHPDGGPILFRLVDGNVVVPRNDPPTVRKLVEMSNMLGARVFGDDGERYGLDGSWTHPAAAVLAHSLTHGARDRRSFLRSIVGITQDRRTARAVLGDRAPFRKGDRVRDRDGNEGAVLGLEFVDGASRDLVVVRVGDGRLLRYVMNAGALVKVDPDVSRA